MDTPIKNWNGSKRILVVLAHPDDPEFFLGATLAKWAADGHKITYCLLTLGDRGSSVPGISRDEVSRQRKKEQEAAGRIAGIDRIRYLDYEDGYLVPSLEAREKVVRVIREECPDILVSCDPTNYFPRSDYVNHPDHRAAGQIVLDAVFPAAGSQLYYVEQIDAGLKPHMPEELWLSLTVNPNIEIDVTDWWSIKIQALLQHKSQIGEENTFIQRMKSKYTPDSSEENPRYIESFKRIIFRR